MRKSTSKREMAAWIAGFWDGEGSVVLKRTCNGKKHAAYYLSVSNTDIELMKYCSKCLADLGIEHTAFEQRVRPKRDGCVRKPLYTFNICRAENVRRFSELVHMKSPDKISRLNQIIAWIDRPRYIERFAIEHEKQLRELYPAHTVRCVVKQLGLKQGAHSRITLALKHLGIWQEKFHQGVACRCRRS